MQNNAAEKTNSWKSSHLQYFLSDLGMDLNRTLTLPRVFMRIAERFENKTALLEKSKSTGKYEPLTYGQVKEQCSAFAGALLDLGMQPKDRFGILLKNSPAWVVSDFGTTLAAGATVPIYDTLTPSAILHILKDSGAIGVIVEDAGQFKKIEEIRSQLPSLKFVITRRSEGVALKKDSVFSFEEFLAKGQNYLKANPRALYSTITQSSLDDVASIVYTSGTTGDPKGVMLTHRNFLSNVYGIVSVSDVSEEDTFLSILPLSHVFERTIGYYVAILFGATIAYAESIDTVAQNLVEVKPTLCACVPRLFEKIHAKMVKNLDAGSPLKKRLFDWALDVGRRVQEEGLSSKDGFKDRRQRHRQEDISHRRGDPKGLKLRLEKGLAEKLVYKKIQQAMGGRLRFFVSGGAPLSPDIHRFFQRLGLTIYEGYGLTETSPVVSFNYGQKARIGTVGKLLPHVQVKFSSEGEILVKGPNVMAGYFNRPDATRDAVDAEGWFRTGDIGTFDEDNYLKITDRLKELIVMSNGKNVAPLPIENKINHSPLINHSMVVGNNRKFISALVFTSPQEKVAKEAIQSIIDEVNTTLARYEQIKTFEIIPQELSIENGELTPTLKLKRRVLDKKFNDVIEKMYQGQEG